MSVVNPAVACNGGQTVLKDFYEALGNGDKSVQVLLPLSNTVPSAESTPPSDATATWTLGNVNQVPYTYYSTQVLVGVTNSQTSGIYMLTANYLTLTATGGAIRPFRYIYNDTPTSPANPLTGYWDYGTSVTLTDGQYLDIDLTDAGNKVLSLA